VLDHHVRGELAIGSEALTQPLVVERIAYYLSTLPPCRDAILNTTGDTLASGDGDSIERVGEQSRQTGQWTT